MWVLTGNWLHPHFVVVVVVVVQSGTRAAISAGDLRGRGAGRFPLFLFGLRAGRAQISGKKGFRFQKRVLRGRAAVPWRRTQGAAGSGLKGARSGREASRGSWAQVAPKGRVPCALQTSSHQMCAAWPVADLPLPALELPRPDAAQPTPFWGLEGGSPIRAESEMRPFGDASLDPPPSVLGKRSHTVSHTISLRPRMETFRSASGGSSPSHSRQTPRHPGLGAGFQSQEGPDSSRPRGA